MSSEDDVPAEMTTPRRPALDDAAAERLLRGHALEGDESLSALVGALHDAADAPVTPRGELAALLSEGFDPATISAAPDVPVWAPAAGRRGLLRHPGVRLAGLSVAAKVLLGGGVAVAGVGTAAGLGTLPAPVQDRVAAVVGALTPFEVPSAPQADDAPRQEQPQAPTSERPAVPATPERGTTAPDPVQRPAPADDAQAPAAGRPAPPAAPAPGTTGDAPPKRPVEPGRRDEAPAPRAEPPQGPQQGPPPDTRPDQRPETAPNPAGQPKVSG